MNSLSDFVDLARQGALHAWLYIPAALLLGALHGLEPGHSKTMMAAFIIAIRGTIFQAVLLGLCAAFSHSLIVWLLAGVALHYGSQVNAESAEPYFQIVSGVIIVGLAAWMAGRTRRDVAAEARHAREHGHAHAHGVAHAHAHAHSHEHVHATGTAEVLTGHDALEFQDAHEQAHAEEIQRRFSGGKVTNAQIALFGFTGGLLPCPAAFTIVLVCLQLKRFALGIVMVLAFSVGLAVTLVTVGVLAAWSLRHAGKRFDGFGSIARKLPYLSSVLLLLIGLYVGLQGWQHLASAH